MVLSLLIPDHIRATLPVTALYAPLVTTHGPASIFASGAILRANLSSYNVPKRFHLLEYDDIPRTLSANVQRHRLSAILLTA